MSWGSWSEFWAMGGQGLYVWGSYAVTFCALALELRAACDAEAPGGRVGPRTLMKPRQKRLMWISLGVAVLGVATALVLSAFNRNLVFFFTPSQVAAREAPVDRSFRVGGMVEKGSLKRQPDGVTVQFVVTDTAKTITVQYRGILPDLFREGKGVVTQGRLAPDGTFVASEVLAKHDENYMPPEAAHAISQAQANKAADTLVMPPGEKKDMQSKQLPQGTRP